MRVGAPERRPDGAAVRRQAGEATPRRVDRVPVDRVPLDRQRPQGGAPGTAPLRAEEVQKRRRQDQGGGIQRPAQAARPAPQPGLVQPDRAQARQDRENRPLQRENRPVPREDARRPADPGAARRIGGDEDRKTAPRDPARADRRIGPGGVGAVVGAGIAAGVAGGLAAGFLAPTDARRLDDIRHDRREDRQGDSTFIREPGRTIVEQNGRSFIVHDENDRFRALGLADRRERRGNEFVDTIDRPDGVQILTYTDLTGRLLRRVRRTRDGRLFVLIDNGNGGRLPRYEDDVIVLTPPALRIPRDRYIVDYRDADEGLLYETLIAPPLAAPPRRYTLDQVRYSPDVRAYMRSVDINTINFDTGSWDVPATATRQLVALGAAINQAIAHDPNSVFLIEGYTDATGNPNDNLSLSDRRAQSVAEILTKDFAVPPENLTTQGYGQQNLKENTPGPSAVNRRVVVRNITQLLAAGDAPPAAR
jgi:outer membrane protein OmpA-like peptidoglycan-associated protein